MIEVAALLFIALFDVFEIVWRLTVFLARGCLKSGT